MTWMSLRVDTTAADKEGLLEALEQVARDFFGEDEFRLDGPVDIEPDTVVVSAAGEDVVVKWSGRATFVNWREEDPWPNSIKP